GHDRIVVVDAHLDSQPVVRAQRVEVVDNLEAGAILTAGVLLVIDGREVHEDVEAEVGVFPTQPQGGRQRGTLDHGGVIAVLRVGVEGRGAEARAPPLEHRPALHPLSYSGPPPRTWSATS